MSEPLPKIATIHNGPPCPECKLKLSPAAKEPPMWWCGYCYIYFDHELKVFKRGQRSAKRAPKEVAPKFDDNGFAFEPGEE